MRPEGGHMRLHMLLAAVIATATATIAQAASIQPGSGASVSKTATGIYEIAVTNGSRATYRTLALVDQGRIIELHTRRGTTYLARKAGSPSVRVTSQKFNEMITIAGGINRDVNKLPAATRSSFMQKAGLGDSASGDGGSAPLQVPPTDGACPIGYEIHISFATGRKVITCRLAAGVMPEAGERPESLLAFVKSALRAGLEGLVAPAEARLAEIHYEFRIFMVLHVGITYLDADIGEFTALTMQVAGAEVTWLESAPAGD